MSDEKKEVRILKVKSSSNVQSLAGCIAGCYTNGEDIELRAIGASAVNQMIKAFIVARGYIAAKGKDIALVPGFGNLVEDDKERTMIRASIKTI